MKRKSLFILFLMVILCFSLTTVAFAATNNIGVSTTIPVITNVGIQPYSTSKPDLDNSYSNGSLYSIGGNAANENLYTDSCFSI